MRDLFRLLCILTAVSTPIAAASQAARPPSVSVLEVGSKAPALSIDIWIKGDSIDAFVPGRVYLVEFWGTWCAPCIESIPHLNELQHKHREAGLTVLGVASHEFNGLDQLKDFVAERADEMDYVIGYDEDLSMEFVWQTHGQKNTRFHMPEAFLVDGSGIVVWKGHPAEAEEMDGAIEKALAAASGGRK